VEKIIALGRPERRAFFTALALISRYFADRLRSAQRVAQPALGETVALEIASHSVATGAAAKFSELWAKTKRILGTDRPPKQDN
jgi:hypothetical protein